MSDQVSPASTSYDRRTTERPDESAAEREAPDGSPAAAPAPRHAGRVIFGSVVLVGGAFVAVALLATHRSAGAARTATVLTSAVDAGPIVRTAIAGVSAANPHVQLIGEARPYASVTLYAKVSGYLRSVTVDMGDHVKAGQVIATIESPETDRAFSAAKADYDNKQVTADRMAKLVVKKYVSPEEADRATADAAVAHERLAGLEEQRAYELLRAPFAGTVTARFADPGALVQNAASSQTSALPVVTVAETDSLRIQVFLDQGDAANVRAGTQCVITLAERPAFSMPATVARVSGELDAKTRKMVAELDVKDRDGAIVPGSFVQVQMAVEATAKPQAPVEALVVRDGKTFVAEVTADSRIHFQPVTVAQNDGRMVTFVEGVKAGDRLALSLGSAIADGALVRVDTASAQAQAAPATAAGRRP